MSEIQRMREAMLRLTSFRDIQYQYDPANTVFGDGPIHFLVEVEDKFFVAWENNDTGVMIINPITRFDLDELEDLGFEEPWTLLRLPATVPEGLQLLKCDKARLSDVYHRMEQGLI
jgi:hypothetical protein